MRGETGCPLIAGAAITFDCQLAKSLLWETHYLFVGEVAGAFGQFANYPNIAAWVRRFQDRPAYRAALAKGGPYNLGPKT